ncbi:hypothetical protein [Slackia piriformis]|uniref:hypothetical protein n=1 Tax=Slackia piriformis TaxID=626934 RepID=UPI0032C002D1
MPICVSIGDMKDTAAFAETVHAAQAPVIVTKNGKKTLASMSPEVYEGLRLEAARAQLYDIVDKGISDIESERSRNAKTLTAVLRKQYGL